MQALTLPSFQLSTQSYVAKVTLGETVKFPKVLKVEALSARDFPMVTYGDFEQNSDALEYWKGYIQERFKVTFIQGSRYFMLFRRANRFNGKFLHIVVLAGRNEIFTMRNAYEAKALVKIGHLGRGRAKNRVILSQNPINTKGLTFPFWFRGVKKDYPCNIKRIGNMPNEFILWR